MSTITVDQRESALDRANEVRLAMSEVRTEIVTGSLAFAEALDDPRAASFQVFRLLTSLHRIGPHHARKVMARAGVPEHKRVKALTPRQQHALTFELAMVIGHEN